MNAQRAVVLNETQFAEAVHEEADAGAGCAYHLGQCFLAHLGNHRFRCALFAELREQQQRPGQPLLAGIEKLVYQVFLDAGVTGEKVSDENFRKYFFLVKYSYHFSSFNPEYAGRGERCRRGHSLRLDCGDTFFTEEAAGSEQRDGCFFAPLGNHGKSNFAFLDIKHGIGNITLRKNGLALLQIENRPAKARPGEEGRWPKNRLFATRCADGFHCS